MCTEPEGYFATADGYNNAKVTINPNVLEICDNIDNNCDEEIDEGENTTALEDAPFCYPDNDQNGIGTVVGQYQVCLSFGS